MALFKKLFSSKLVANSDVIPAELNDEQDVNNENQNPVGKTKDDESKTNLITIKWGTGLPIDVIFHYIHKNFEEEGFQDALVNSDITYRDTKEKIIRTDLEMLFKRITLRYKSDIREMVLLKKTYEEHLAEIEEMQELLNADDPKMTTMIESYRRGFLKGITAATLYYIEKK